MRNIYLLFAIFFLAIDRKWYKIAYRLTSFTYRDVNNLKTFMLWAEFSQYVDVSYTSKQKNSSNLARVKLKISAVDYELNVIKEKKAYQTTGGRRWFIVPNSLRDVS